MARKPNNERRQPNRRQQQEESIDERNVSQSKVFEHLKFDASNIIFNNLLGTRLSSFNNVTVPGIAVYTLTPNYYSKSDMINMVSTSIYTFVRHANSGRTNYEKSDLMIYLLAVAEIMKMVTEAARVLGIANYYQTRNLYSSKLIDALGYESDDFRSNMANYRYALNNIIHRIKAFAIPRVFNYYDEVITTVSSVYKDEDHDMSQLLMFRYAQFGKFDPKQTGGSTLVFETAPGSQGVRVKFSKLLEMINQFMDVLRDNEDINIMSGDILKTYGAELFIMDPLPTDFYIEPVYDPLVLMQINNATIVDPSTIDNIDEPLSQLDNQLSRRLQFDTLGPASAFFSRTRLLNSNIESVTPDLIFTLNRFQVTTYIDKSTSYLLAGESFITKVELFVINPDGYTMSAAGYRNIAVNEGAPVDHSVLPYITKFKQYPLLYVDGSDALPIGDLQYMTVLAPADVDRMHDARFILLFQTKQMA